MKIIIIGFGRMGFSLARELDAEGHQVSVIDPRPDRLEMAQTRLDVMAVGGSGCSRDTLREAGAEDADLLLAVSGSDEVNMMSCLIARELGVSKRVARIESEQLFKDVTDLRSVLGVDEVIAPPTVTVERLYRIQSLPGITESAEFASGSIILRALRVDTDSQLTASPLSDLRARFPGNFIIAAVRRGDDLLIPTGTFTVRRGDVIYVVMNVDALDQFLDTFKLHRKENRRVFIYGASDIGMALAGRLAEESYDTVLLDDDAARCQVAAEHLPRTAIIHGSPLDGDLMLDLKIGESSFYGLSERAESNFASAVTAKRLGAHRSVMMTDGPEQNDVFDRPPIDAVVNPIALSVGAILRSVRSGKVVFLLRLSGQQAEALEIEAIEGAPGIGRPLREVSVPQGTVVAAVTGSHGPRVATGDTVIHPGDHVIVVSMASSVHAAIDFFSRGGNSNSANGSAR